MFSLDSGIYKILLHHLDFEVIDEMSIIDVIAFVEGYDQNIFTIVNNGIIQQEATESALPLKYCQTHNIIWNMIINTDSMALHIEVATPNYRGAINIEEFASINSTFKTYSNYDGALRSLLSI